MRKVGRDHIGPGSTTWVFKFSTHEVTTFSEFELNVRELPRSSCEFGRPGCVGGGIFRKLEKVVGVGLQTVC